ncbi:PhzF family phenazine biosynthesis protein [Actinomadura sp. NPDC047616]|uniref:PhzF family phenazine biosynthesis protein n=1 Tax=Actinomadura sp. NPDC047616 TaxID=3155914 RepID=UPI0034007D97
MSTFIARAFTGQHGAHGNQVVVVLADDELPGPQERQKIAAGAPAPATVFVAPDRRQVRIHNRMLERPFAGHPLLGTAAVLRNIGKPVDRLATPAGEVSLWRDDEGAEWLHAPSHWSPNTYHRRVSSPAEVEALLEPPPDEPVQVWAWIDEAAGLVRARRFAPSEGKPEDEACGSACMVLSTLPARPLTVVHGRGSVIRVRPRDTGVDLGGARVID